MQDMDADLPAIVHAKHAGHQVGQGVIAKVRGDVANAETLPRLQADGNMSGRETATHNYRLVTCAHKRCWQQQARELHGALQELDRWPDEDTADLCNTMPHQAHGGLSRVSGCPCREPGGNCA